MRRATSRGFSLIELMVALAILGIVIGLAIPAYNGYIETGREGVLIQNVDSMRLFQEDFRLRNGVYASGTWNPDGGVTTLATNLGWQPDGADGSITYVVTNNAGVSWTVVATDSSGTSITRTYPN